MAPAMSPRANARIFRISRSSIGLFLDRSDGGQKSSSGDELPRNVFLPETIPNAQIDLKIVEPWKNVHTSYHVRVSVQLQRI